MYRVQASSSRTTAPRALRPTTIAFVPPNPKLFTTSRLPRAGAGTLSAASGAAPGITVSAAAHCSNTVQEVTTRILPATRGACFPELRQWMVGGMEFSARTQQALIRDMMPEAPSQ